jgi:glucarate dehydratase
MNIKSREVRSCSPLKIREVHCYLVEPVRGQAAAEFRSLLIQVIGPEGLEGWGEGHSRWSKAEWSGRHQALAALLVGRSPFEIEELSTLELLRHGWLRSAVEMACWDLIGKGLGEPVCHLWGGRFRSYVPLGARLPGWMSPENLGPFARELAEQGFHALLLPSRGYIQADTEQVATVREAAGQGCRLYLDAAAQYSEPDAQDLGVGLESYGLHGLIDPLRSSEVYTLAGFARQTAVPIGLHRALVSLLQVFGAVRSGAGAFLVLDADRLGGLTMLRKAAAVAEAAGVPVLLHEAGGVGIRLAALVHLSAAVSFLDQPCFTYAYRGGYEPLCRGLEIVEGMAAVPEGPGWGVEFDSAKLEEWLLG